MNTNRMLQGCGKAVTIFYIMIVPDLLQQPCDKSDIISKVVLNLLTTCNKQCGHNLFEDLLQVAKLLHV